jgi:acetylornithine deacetylase
MANRLKFINNGATPTLMFGPGDVRKAHQPDKYVPVDDLIVTVRTLALTALRFCGYEELKLKVKG